MRPIAVLDIDTTLANNDHRADRLVSVCSVCSKPPKCDCDVPKLHTPQEAWDAFLHPELLAQDTAQEHAIEVLEKMRSLNWWLVFMTGRNERLRDVTERWLAKHMLRRSVSEPLIMRPLHEKGKPASVMKEEMFLTFRDSHGLQNAPFLFFEDDKYVLGMWQKYGMVFQCPEAWATMNPDTHERTHEPNWTK